MPKDSLPLAWILVSLGCTASVRETIAVRLCLCFGGIDHLCCGGRTKEFWSEDRGQGGHPSEVVAVPIKTSAKATRSTALIYSPHNAFNTLTSRANKLHVAGVVKENSGRVGIVLAF